MLSLAAFEVVGVLDVLESGLLTSMAWEALQPTSLTSAVKPNSEHLHFRCNPFPLVVNGGGGGGHPPIETRNAFVL